ncbi:MAG: putative chaperone protein DnaJ [Rickettsiaceae bacterium]|jgi:hypothetical protein|nr:putative chaperone protein DnaJ [Rickettsiaceae bacterium]
MPDSDLPCAMEGCTSPGRYQAKKSPKNINEIILLCLEHIRLHNRNWNYFQDMNEKEIAAYQARQVYSDQPTWRFGAGNLHKNIEIHQKVKEYLGIKPARAAKPNIDKSLSIDERNALKELGLIYPVQKRDVKKAYRNLVKIYHPDHNTNDATKFMAIKTAYDILMNSQMIAE